MPSRDVLTQPNLLNPLLLEGSAGVPGQAMATRGAALPPEWAPLLKHYDQITLPTPPHNEGDTWFNPEWGAKVTWVVTASGGQWVELEGPGRGEMGDAGAPGDDAYAIAVANGFVGDEAAWLASLEGTDGGDGLSAYEVALANGFVGDEATWLASLEGSPGAGGSPGGADRSLQFNDAGVLGGAANLSVGPEGNLLLAELTTLPATPPSGFAQIFARSRAGQLYLDMQRPSGRDVPLQPHFGVNRIGLWAPSSGQTVNSLGIPRNAVGTTSTPVLTSTNLASQSRRWQVASAATANAAAEERTARTVCWRGNAAGLGGFTMIDRISLAITPALVRCFFGLHSSTGTLATTTNPQALINLLGIGFNEGIDTNWQILHNDGAGVPTKVDLGASFPVTSLTNIYTLFIAAPPNGDSVFFRVVEEVSGAVVEHEATTDIPATTTFLAVRHHMNNGGTAAACAYACSGVYIETDY